MDQVVFKIPHQSPNYPESSAYVTGRIAAIIEQSIAEGNNRIFIRTNLKRGLPLENINKVAGPFVEAWAVEQFEAIADDAENSYDLINVQAGKRLAAYDVILQFRSNSAGVRYYSANVDVKATAQDIATSGKRPNITSYARIRSEYVKDSDYIFIILSLKHKVYGDRDLATGMTNGIMEVVSYAVYDLKYISAADISYNPALGSGQLQIRDIHYVSVEPRTTWEFLQMLDTKFIRSKGQETWLRLAKKYGWIKEPA
ncbi:MAG: restriction endonuclease [Chloroflexota bacterium]|nr:restriction endonuclease [Chloroflexota bacterium]